MRAILIDPATQTVREVEIGRSHDAMMEAIGGLPGACRSPFLR